MQYIWLFMMLFSIALLMFTSPQLILNAMTESMKTSLELCISLMAVYCLWMGIINVIKDCGLIDSLSKKSKPLLKKLFGNQNDEICSNLALNVSANLLGAGNAATPPALAAIKQMDDKSGKLNKGMAMLFVINSCGLQLIPTTIIGIRSSLGSANPTDIILPNLLTAIITTAVGILLVSLAYRKRNKP